MTFTSHTYANMVSSASTAQERLFLQYIGPRNDFDIVVIGSGMGGGILTDELADRLGSHRRILMLEAGSFLYLAADGTPATQFWTEPTGVFNTAELLINQLGLTPGVSHGDGPGLQMLLNHYVEDVQDHGTHYQLVHSTWK